MDAGNRTLLWFTRTPRACVCVCRSPTHVQTSHVFLGDAAGPEADNDPQLPKRAAASCRTSLSIGAAERRFRLNGLRERHERPLEAAVSPEKNTANVNVTVVPLKVESFTDCARQSLLRGRIRRK